MIVVGLTGGSGVGKTTVCGWLRACGIPSLDTDRVSRAVTMPGAPCLSELIEFFGKSIIRPDGSLHRKRLADLVFLEKDEVRRAEKTALLNRITHRHILAACNLWLRERQEEGYAAAIIDAPLLFESGFAERCDFIVGVVADRETRIARIMERDRLTRDRAEARLSVQLPDAELIARCDCIIRNDGTEEETEQAVRKLAAEILHRAEAKT